MWSLQPFEWQHGGSHKDTDLGMRHSKGWVSARLNAYHAKSFWTLMPLHREIMLANSSHTVATDRCTGALHSSSSHSTAPLQCFWIISSRNIQF